MNRLNPAGHQGSFMIIFFFLLWLILNGRVTVELILLGIPISALVLLLANRAVGYTLKTDIRIMRNLPVFFLYTLNLVAEILKASAAVMGVVLDPSKKPEPVIVEFHSGLKTELQNVLLANSITLTPGTYTLFQEGDHFVVHCLKREYGEGMEESSFVKYLRLLDGGEEK